MKPRVPAGELQLGCAVAQPLRDAIRFLQPDLLQHDQKLVSAEADRVVCNAQVVLDTRGKFFEHLVAHQMAIGIVDGFKIVHIDEHQCGVYGFPVVDQILFA